MEFSSNPKNCLIENVSTEYLFSYVNSRLNIKNSGDTLIADDSIVYYKLRHNCFKTKFLSVLGLPNFEEVPFTAFDVDSRKTPDTILRFGDKFLIIEYTVVKNYINAIENKKSFKKYDTECKILESRGKIVYMYFPVIALDKNIDNVVMDLNEIASLFDINIIVNTRNIFEDLIESFRYLDWHLNEILPELLANESFNVSVDFQEIHSYPKEIFDIFPLINKRVAKKKKNMQNTWNIVRKNLRSLESQVKMHRSKSKIIISINNTYNNVFIDISKDGVSKNTMLTMIQTQSIDLLDFVKVVGKFSHNEDPFNIYGEVTLKKDLDRSQFSVNDFDTESFENYLLSKYKKLAHSNIDKFNLLANSDLESQINEVEGNYFKMLNEKRNSNNNNIITYKKSPFIFPVSTLEQGNYKKIDYKGNKKITNILINQIRYIKKFERQIIRNIDYDVMTKINKELHNITVKLQLEIPMTFRLIKNVKSIIKQKELLEKNSEDFDKAKPLLIEYNKIKSEFYKVVGEPTRKSYANRISLPKSIMSKYWEDEISHFNSEKGIIKINPDEPFDLIKNKFQELLQYLFSEINSEPLDDIYSNTEPQGKEFVKICLQFKELADSVSNQLMRKRIMHVLLMISRLAYSLLFFSNIKLNKEDFVYDNLGYKDCLLLVKGGKKIIATKKSRLFKFTFKIDDELSWLYETKHTEIFTSQGEKYVTLPWQNWHFNMLKKASELYYAYSNFYICSYLESGLNLKQFESFISVKTLNMLSQRRKLEIWFGSFRYLYLNSLSTHTNVLELIKSMVDYDYDPYMYLMQRCFAKNFKNICKYAKENKIYDILTEEVFENFDLCAEKFDEAVFMTKAPFDRQNEHLNNLKSILETHKYFMDNYGTLDANKILEKSSLNIYKDDYLESAFEDDFKFDPKLCFCIGKFAQNKILNMTSKENLGNKFSKILNDSYTSIKTNKGMRSDEGNFWGKKGYDVIFDNEENKRSVIDFLKNFPKTRGQYNKILDDNEISLKNKIEKMEKLIFQFDMKDKDQYKGPREIYVMSETTKILQQPLERMFKELCRFVPNELINKKSNVRPKYIHSKVFEFSSQEDEKTYCTLDCRKWAPRSNIWKYFYFILGMKNLLPEGFYDYFINVWFFMFDKKVRVQKHYVEKLRNNKTTAELSKYFIQRKDDEDFELQMPYSFMMGIYNYLSSLFHAMTQLYFNEKISSKDNVQFNLQAHSDDSGGVIISSSYEKNLKYFKIYEIFQKSCNHLMSTKKSSLSRTFFEIISIMYNKKRLIPMTHKFLSNVSFEPKGNGWVDDISTVVSKVVELFSNGATMLQCYLTMLSMGEMIRKFYHLPRYFNLSSIPLSFGGLFNMHPLHLILLGTDSQEIMLDNLETPGARSFRISIYKSLFKDYIPGKGAIVNYRIPYYKRHNSTIELNQEDKELLNYTAICGKGRTFEDKLLFYNSLFSNSFTYSLSGVDMCQIFTYTLFTKTFILKSEGEAHCDLKRFCKMYGILKTIKLSSNYEDYPKSNFHNYMSSSERIKFDLNDIDIPNLKTCKPIIYNTFQNLGLGLSFSTINEIVAYNNNDKIKLIFDNPTRIETLTRWVDKTIKGDNLQNKLNILSKLSRRDLDKSRSSYCFIPSGINIDTIERFWTYINIYCTRRYYISSKKPQYFTLENFQLWNINYDKSKHLYLLYKIYKSSKKTKEIGDKIIENMKNCKCLFSRNEINDFQQFIQLNNEEIFSEKIITIPFAVYHNPQKRGINVWYGSSSFSIYSMWGSVKTSLIEGNWKISIITEAEEFLSEIWNLYNIFTKSRGINSVSPEFSYNNEPQYKLGFNDLNNAILIEPNSSGMMITDSEIQIRSVSNREILVGEDNFTFLGDVVDFEIYHNYDINEGFYDFHNLKELHKLIFPKEFKIEKINLMKNFNSSKISQILSTDESQFNYQPIDEKYKPQNMLGSSCSFTRSLILSDEKNITKYKSSVHPQKLEMGILEGQTFRDFPVIDLINKSSFARLNYTEVKSITKIINLEKLDYKDNIILDKLVKKIGLTPMANTIVMFKTVFTELSSKDTALLPKEVMLDFLYIMLKSALNSIEDETSIRFAHTLKGTKTEICEKLYLLLKFDNDHTRLADYLFRLFLRAQIDNPGTFWEERKDNIYCSLFRPRLENIGDQCSFIRSCLKHLKYKGFVKKLLTVRNLLLAKRAIDDDLIEFFEDQNDMEYDGDFEMNFENNNNSIKNFYFNEDDLEYGMDAVSGGDEPEDYCEREWPSDGRKLKFYLLKNNSYHIMQDTTLKEDFSGIKIYTLNNFYQPVWLGKGNFYNENENGINYFVSEFPGRTNRPKNLFEFEKAEKKSFTLEDISKSIKEELEQNKLTNKKEISLDELRNMEDSNKIEDFQLQVLENNGIKNPRQFIKYFFKKENLKIKFDENYWENFLKSLGDKLFEVKNKDIEENIFKKSFNLLPGFTGIIDDPRVVAELESLFGNHYMEILAGEQTLSQKSVNHIFRNIKRIYNKANDAYKSLLTFILSLIRDCKISNKSDGWFLDGIIEVVNDVEDTIIEPDDHATYIPPKYTGLELNYEDRNIW